MFRRFFIAGLAAALLFQPVMGQDRDAKVTVEETNDENGRVVITRNESYQAVKTNGFWSNWTIGVDAGIGYYLGDYDKLASFGERTAFACDFFVEKFATPAFGFGITLGVQQLKGASPVTLEETFVPHFITDQMSKSNEAWLQKAWVINPHIDLIFDLDNIFGGYNPFRCYNATLLLGAGMMAGLGHDYGHSSYYFEPTFNMGLLNSFRINDFLSILVNVRGLLTGDNLDGEVPRKSVDGAISLTAGVSFKLGDAPKRSFRRVEDVTIEHYNDKAVEAEKAEIKELQKKIKAIEAENKALSASSGSAVKGSVPIAMRINFASGSKAIDNAGIIDVEAAADAIKSTPGTRYAISGFSEGQADLSSDRAKAVIDMLTGRYGVPSGQLELRNTGKESGDCVVISTIE